MGLSQRSLKVVLITAGLLVLALVIVPAVYVPMKKKSDQVGNVESELGLYQAESYASPCIDSASGGSGKGGGKGGSKGSKGAAGSGGSSVRIHP